MTNDQIKLKALTYKNIFIKTGVQPSCCEPNLKGPNAYQMASHAAWMCGQIPRLIFEEKRETAVAWLRFVEGMLWASGAMSFDDMVKDGPTVLGIK
jgi:hypothetical protein